MDENKMPENDGWKKNARLAIYAMAGFYLLTLAYQMFRAISTSHGNEQLVMIVATILFLIVGVGLIGFGTINVYKNMKKNQSTDKDRRIPQYKSRSQRRRKVEIINITSQEKTSGKVKLAGSFFAYMMSQVQIGACTRICI